jgi:hypothetical protein
MWWAAENKKKKAEQWRALNIKSNLIGGDDGSFHQQFVLAANQGLQKGSVNSQLCRVFPRGTLECIA